MIPVTYYVATSIDGYIASCDGSIDWLDSVEAGNEDYGYAEFYKTCSGLLMGNNTFKQIQTLGKWPYGKKPCSVWTHSKIISKPHYVVETIRSPKDVILAAQEQGLKHLWLVGGSKLAAAFEKGQLIKKYIISIVPVILGSMIPLVYGRKAHNLELVNTQINDL